MELHNLNKSRGKRNYMAQRNDINYRDSMLKHSFQHAKPYTDDGDKEYVNFSNYIYRIINYTVNKDKITKILEDKFDIKFCCDLALEAQCNFCKNNLMYVGEQLNKLYLSADIPNKKKLLKEFGGSDDLRKRAKFKPIQYRDGRYTGVSENVRNNKDPLKNNTLTRNIKNNKNEGYVYSF